ncbi:hypothetical protein Rhopal_003088-T1 [Rhodotorula paludigena]|uniref:Eisosome component PIL1-domain-containing protein n=1 Tax=Rhodotorula paludigena TaxID=86838 RepID=A0AAV5GKQ1_9BASI|nr:hypothetical protein Rhopal_003088-T1 [Rhodotorula paludigena]
MAEQKEPTSSKLSSLFSRATERLPAVSALPHLAREGRVRLDPRQPAETLQLQILIKSLSGVVQDRSSLAREEQRVAKAIYDWSKDDKGDDLRDTCDRLAWTVYCMAELDQEAAKKVEESRVILKDIRNFENDLVPRRRNQQSLATKITALEKEIGASKKGADVKQSDQLSKLRGELSQLEAENATFEQSFETLKRQKLHEAFSAQFRAQRELGEKMALVAGYGDVLLQGMESEGVGADYRGKDRTAQVKVELESALKNWVPGPTPRLQQQGGLDRSDTRSFGETHASQLSQLDSQSSLASRDAHSSQTSHLTHPPPMPTLHSQAELDTTQHSHQRFVPPLLGGSSHASGSSIPPPLPPHPPRSSASPSSPSGNLRVNLSPVSPVLPSSPPRATAALPVDLPPPGVESSAPPEPTVAETGAPQVGTGGPSSGVLRPRKKSDAASSLSSLPPAAAAAPMPGTFNAAGWGGDGGAQASSSGHGQPLSEVGSSLGPSAGAAGEHLPAYGEGDEEHYRARDQAEQILAQERESKARM